MRDYIELLESTHLEFVLEAASDDIIASLEATPFNDTLRKSGKMVHVLVPINQRRTAIQQLLDILPDAKYDPSMPGSSLGGINYLGGKIIIKPSGKQGEASAGVANEIELYNILDQMSQKYSTFSVTFRDTDGKTLEIKNAIGVEHAGKETQGRLKGDIRIVTKDQKHPISIKKVQAEMWESADRYYGPTAFKLLQTLQSEAKIELQGLGKFNQDGVEYVRIRPEVAVEPTPEEVKDVVFGADIEAQEGAVVVQTFASQHFVQEEDSITIECEEIIKKMEDIPRSHLMVWLIRNDQTRNPKGGIPGLRITAAVQTRAFGKHGTKNVLYVSRDGKELENPMADVAEKYRKISDKKVSDIEQKIQDISQRKPVLKPRSKREEKPREKR